MDFSSERFKEKVNAGAMDDNQDRGLGVRYSEGGGAFDSGSKGTAAGLPDDSEEDVPIDRDTEKRISMLSLALASMVAAGVQFGWALQLSLLTPYVQTLGIPHAWASFIWLCGPITGLLVQPCVGVWSDRCTHPWGRRRPFILAGVVLVTVAVVTIGFSADVGYLLGDNIDAGAGPRIGACVVFVFGFWLLDLANNTVQGPVRALIADLSGPEHSEAGNAFFSLWMAVGNILGYSTGANGSWYNWFPFLKTAACSEPCANLKAAFLIAVLFLVICTMVTLTSVIEVPLSSRQFQAPQSIELAPLLRESPATRLSDTSSTSPVRLHSGTIHHKRPDKNESLAEDKKDCGERSPSRGNKHRDSEADEQRQESEETGVVGLFRGLVKGINSLPRTMHAVMAVTALCWMAWFPFLLFDTDWMGREVYRGKPGGTSASAALYQLGVREGALGLLLNSVVLGVTSLCIERLCQRFGASQVWAASSILVAVLMASTGIVTSAAGKQQAAQGGEHPHWARWSAVGIFTLLGGPLAVTFSVPYAMTADLTAETGGGQGLAMGILNLAIVVPQVVVSLVAGPWDALFGGGNEPAFAAAAVFAGLAGVVAMFRLPNTRPDPSNRQRFSVPGHP